MATPLLVNIIDKPVICSFFSGLIHISVSVVQALQLLQCLVELPEQRRTAAQEVVVRLFTE